MGQAKRKTQGMLGSKRRRFYHLMKLISRYDDVEIRRFADRRKLI
jgi:hypothetical protein